MSASTTNHIHWAEAGFIGTITVAHIWYINTYDDSPEISIGMVLIIQENLGNAFSKFTANQYKIETNNKMNNFFHYPNSNSLLSCENSHLCRSTTVNDFQWCRVAVGIAEFALSRQCWHMKSLVYFGFCREESSWLEVLFKKMTQDSTPVCDK